MGYYRLPSYDDTRGECYSSLDSKDEPCWGEVGCIDEYEGGDGEWCCVYSCEGHQYHGYEPSRHKSDEVEPKECDF